MNKFTKEGIKMSIALTIVEGDTFIRGGGTDGIVITGEATKRIELGE